VAEPCLQQPDELMGCALHVILTWESMDGLSKPINLLFSMELSHWDNDLMSVEDNDQWYRIRGEIEKTGQSSQTTPGHRMRGKYSWQRRLLSPILEVQHEQPEQVCSGRRAEHNVWQMERWKEEMCLNVGNDTVHVMCEKKLKIVPRGCLSEEGQRNAVQG
jgi:hypothetical protein